MEGTKKNSNLDVLFIYPALSVQERYGNRKVGDTGGHLPPIGIMSIASYLREKGYRVDVIDTLVINWINTDILNHIRKSKPKIIGISSITPIFHRACECAQAIKEEFSDTMVIIGGPHVTIEPVEVLEENKCFDIGVCGEGEITTVEILELYIKHGYRYGKFVKDHELLSQIEGIVFRENENIVVNKSRELISNLDILPFPARDLVPIEKYIPLPNQYKRLPVVHMVVIRGCPYKCTFCSNNTIFGRKIRSRSPIKVIEEIKHLVAVYGAKDISFWDDMMTVNKKWMYELCDLIIREKIDITWTCYARADSVTKDLLIRMKEAGCWNIFFGFETGDQQLLDNLEKGITLDDIRKASRWCKDVDIEIRASFMIALPGETPELAEKTIKFAKEINPEYAQFCITTPYPGTKLFKEAEKWGSLSKDYSQYNIWEPVFIPFGYKDRSEIEQMEKKANFMFYCRPRSFFNLIKKIRSFEDIKRYLKGFRIFLGFLKA